MDGAEVKSRTQISQGSVRFGISGSVAILSGLILGFTNNSTVWAVFAILAGFLGLLQAENLSRTFVIQVPFLTITAILAPSYGWVILATYALVTLLTSKSKPLRLVSLLLGDLGAYAVLYFLSPVTQPEAWPLGGCVYLLVRTILSKTVSQASGLALDTGAISGGWAFFSSLAYSSIGLTIFYFDRVEMSFVLGVQLAITGLCWLIATAAYQKCSESFVAGLVGLGNLLSYAHAYTAGHSRRVAYLARETGRRIGIPEWRLDSVVQAALLHDIGKLAVDERILEKPGRLTDEEFGIIKTHPVVGQKIIASIEELQPISTWIRHHHERMDGKGYPDGIVQKAIPIESRLIAVIDAYDAMTGTSADGHRRLYRDPVSSDSALEELKRCSGTQFDARVVKTFTRVVRSNQRSAS